MGRESLNGCEIRKLDAMRQIVIEVTEEGRRWNLVHGLMQIDITRTRQRLAAMKQNGGEAPSMTGFIIHCLATALEQDKSLQAIRKGNALHIYDDVDVSTVIERFNDKGEPVPTSLIIRRANEKALRDIHAEIREAETAPLEGSVLGNSEQARKTNLLLKLPRFVRKMLWWWGRRSPKFRKDNLGTVHVTAVGMFATGADAGWGIPVAPWPLILTIGTISSRMESGPDGQPRLHESLNMTMTLDHDIVDGGPATRFIVAFRTLLQDGHGLDGFAP